MVASMRIVVGVDGSPCSSLAADWAAAEAVRRGTSLSLQPLELLTTHLFLLRTCGVVHRVGSHGRQGYKPEPQPV